MGAPMVRKFSAAGPCLTLGRMYRQTDSYLYFQPVNQPCANPRRVLKCLPAHWSPHQLVTSRARRAATIGREIDP